MKLVTSEKMRELDRRAVRGFGLRGIILMENAGRGVAEIVKRELCGGRCKRVSVVAGKGNNGGDGFVCARHLKNAGFEVEVFSFADIRAFKGDAGTNARIWKRMGGETEKISSPGDIKRYLVRWRHSSVIVDAIFGTGLSEEVKGVYRNAIDVINELKKPVVSVDVPSGLDATRGRVLGSAIKATVTATMALAKVGFYIYPGRDYTGRVEIIDIGIPGEITEDDSIRWNLIDEVMVKRTLKPRTKDTHKGTYGHTLVVGGSTGKTGAAYMAAMGAMRVGAGLVTIALPESLNPIMEVKTTEVMTLPLPEAGGGMLAESSYAETEMALDGKSALVLGPGLGAVSSGYVRKVIEGCVKKNIPFVIDADGLNALRGDLSALKRAARVGGRIIITPHPAEAARLLNTTAKKVQADRIGSAQRLFKEAGCIVALKGASTVVVSERGVFINPTGNPGMATAGTGDILSGMLGGLLSCGLSPHDAAVIAVYLHGLAGDRVAEKSGEAGMIATDILSAIPSALNSFVG